jgi:hypothetical protein
MLLFVYAYSPTVLLWNGTLQERFPNRGDLEFVQLVNLLGVAGFCAGCLWGSSVQSRRRAIFQEPSQYLSPAARQKILRIAVLLGVAAVAGFTYAVFDSGGPLAVFSRPKPFLNTASGYLGELPMFSLPAVFLLAIALQGKPLSLRHILLALFFVSSSTTGVLRSDSCCWASASPGC